MKDKRTVGELLESYGLNEADDKSLLRDIVVLLRKHHKGFDFGYSAKPGDTVITAPYNGKKNIGWKFYVKGGNWWIDSLSKHKVDDLSLGKFHNNVKKDFSVMAEKLAEMGY